MPVNRQELHILVIDDDPVNLLLTCQALTAEGYITTEADNGEAALLAFSARPYDLVLLDVIMPGLNGFEVCRKMRTLTGGVDVPILIMTGLDDDESIRNAYDAGATDFITKPITWSLLAHRVRYMLRASEAMEALNQSRTGLANAQRIAKIGSWNYDLLRNELHWSDEIFRILEITPGTNPDPYGAFISTVHPEDRDRVAQVYRNALRNRKACKMEHRLQMPDGRIKWVSFQGLPDFEVKEAGEGYMVTIQDITERKLAEDRIQYLAYYDELTGLPNRNLFQENLSHALASARRHRRRLGVVMFNLNRFRRINDTFGHAVGDLLLKQISELIQNNIRSGDNAARLKLTGVAPDDSLVAERDPLNTVHLLNETKTMDSAQPTGFGAEDLEPGFSGEGLEFVRWAGDEFAITALDLASAESAGLVAQRVLADLNRPCFLEGHEITMTACAGIAVYPEDGDSVEELVKNAQSALWSARNLGPNSCQFYTQNMNAHARHRLTLESSLRQALEKNQLELFYQPLVKAGSGEIAGAEALMRWRHPDRGLVAPGEFIPLAEETGLIIPMGEWVLATTCAQNKVWQQAGYPAITISVNISAMHFRKRALINHVREALTHAGMEGLWMDLEVTESVLMNDLDTHLATMDELRSMGIQFSIDDFGTGYSSLSYLKRLPVHALKIDRSFVSNLPNDEENLAIIRAVVALGHSLGLSIVAEGVETLPQSQLLVKEGIDLLQGYFFSKPVPVDVFSQLLAKKMPLPHPCHQPVY